MYPRPDRCSIVTFSQCSTERKDEEKSEDSPFTTCAAPLAAKLSSALLEGDPFWLLSTDGVSEDAELF